MKSLKKHIVCTLLVSALVPCLAQAQDNQDEKKIITTLSAYEEALNKSDTSKITNLYTTGGVLMAPDAPSSVGREKIEESYKNTLKEISLKLKFNVDEVKLLNEHTALLRSHSNGTVKINGSDKPAEKAAFKELFILDKQKDGEWKFSHYSFSTAPVDK